jgi:Family of unknown function (DUF6221)
VELIEWLRAQLDEDEAWARAACQAYPYATDKTLPAAGVHWRWVGGEEWETVVPDPVGTEFVDEECGSVHLATVEEWPTDSRHPMPRTYDGGIQELDPSAAGHIIRWDPARVLAELVAKRWLLDEIEDELGDDDQQVMTNDRLRQLALPYADRPGYDEEWRKPF